MGVLWGMADLHAGPGPGSPAVEISDDIATGVGGLFRARYPEMVRLADLLGADDPEDIAQEAFARLIRKHASLRNPESALAYVRASVCNLTRNRHRHLRVVRLRTPAGHHEDSSEQVAMLNEDHREVLAALAGLPPRRREAIVLRYWLDLSEREIAATMGVSAGTVKSHVSRGLAALTIALGDKA
jgi:RNA polymerase sigma factor (sigma-70 family)